MNKDEWGNIELPGFDDSKLLNPKLNVVLAAQTESFKENSKKTGKANWATLASSNEHKQALRKGWDKPGARESKSTSVLEVLARPGVLEAHQERARQNGKKSMKPVVSPQGIFQSAGAWAKHMNLDTAMFGYRANKQPDLYYKITQEEYIMLTGKDIV